MTLFLPRKLTFINASSMVAFLDGRRCRGSFGSTRDRLRALFIASISGGCDKVIQ
jgi:hypothetical protein